MRKEIINGTCYALDLFLKMGLVMVLIISYFGGLISLDKLGAWQNITEPQLSLIQATAVLSVFAFMYLFFLIVVKETEIIKLMVKEK